MSKFKIGDSIYVYGFYESQMDLRHHAEITGIEDNGLLIIHEDIRVHPKQCRKLVKKQRRELWSVYRNQHDAFPLKVKSRDLALDILRVYHENGLERAFSHQIIIEGRDI